MIHSIFRDWPWKLLSLVAAVLIWTAVSNEPEMATVIRVPVDYKNSPPDLEISSEVAGSVRLEVTGSTGRLKDFSANPPPVVLDFSSVRESGERTFNIDQTTVKLPKGIEFSRAVPAQLRFVFEPIATRFVPVEVQWGNNSQRPSRVTQVVIEPATLEVTGPASRVGLVRSVSTDPVDLNSIRSGEPFEVSPFISEPQVRFRKFRPVQIKVTLKD